MDETAELKERLRRATQLLREWRDKHGGKEFHGTKVLDRVVSASQTDLARDTQRFLEGK